MNKDQLRKEIRQEKRHFSGEQLAGMSLPVIERLLRHERVRQARTVLMYWSLPDEVDTHQAVDTLRAQGHKVLLPVVTDHCHMELREYEGRASLREGAFHIYEPTGRLFTRYDEIDVAVIPGMSFDNHGNRLGRGKGYYDRFLSQHPDIYKIGICFPFQKRPLIPIGRYDIGMDETL